MIRVAASVGESSPGAEPTPRSVQGRVVDAVNALLDGSVPSFEIVLDCPLGDSFIAPLPDGVADDRLVLVEYERTHEQCIELASVFI